MKDSLMKELVKPESIYHFNQVETKAYHEILRNLAEMNREFDVYVKDLQMFWKLLDAVANDYQELCLVWKRNGSSYATTPEANGMITVHYYTDYTTSMSEAKEELQRLKKRAGELFAEAFQRKPKDKEEALYLLYKYICNNWHYSEKLPTGEYPPYSYTLESIYDRDKAGNRDGVCAGITRCLLYLLKYIRIPVMEVSGTADGDRDAIRGGHSWAIVRYGKGYAHIDATWDLQRDRMTYFLLDDDALSCRRHYWDRRAYPKCMDMIA